MSSGPSPLLLLRDGLPEGAEHAETVVELRDLVPGRLVYALFPTPAAAGAARTLRPIMADTPTLYDWAGGSDALDRVVRTFYRFTLADDLLRPLFEHMSDLHVHYVALWFGEIFGGPTAYSDVHGGQQSHARMIRKHLTLGITEAQRTQWIALMLQAADAEGLPDDPEFRSAFVAYLEWGTRMGNVFTGGIPVPDASPMPVWGWGERPPYVRPTS